MLRLLCPCAALALALAAGALPARAEAIACPDGSVAVPVTRAIPVRRGVWVVMEIPSRGKFVALVDHHRLAQSPDQRQVVACVAGGDADVVRLYFPMTRA